MNEAKRVAKQILDDVFSGELGPGEPVKEIHYKNTMGISKGTFREAIAKLDALGYVVSSEHKSPRIISPTTAEAIEAIEYRIRDECDAIERLCEQGLTDQALKAFEWCVSKAENTTDKLAFNKADAFFHYNIMAYGKKRLGSRFCRLLYFVIFTHMCNTVGLHPMGTVAREHRQILDAIKRAIKEKKPSIASDAMREHLLETKSRIEGETPVTETEVDDYEDYASDCLIYAA